MQTHEEAQVFVHDLNQFGTVQLLEETPAVLSPGKLWKDHGYSYKWDSGIVGTRGTPSLWKQGRSKLTSRFSIRAKWRNSVKETWAGTFEEGREWSVGRYALLFRWFHRNSKPDWFTRFQRKIWNTELHASAHSSSKSDLEHPAKVATKSRKHTIFTFRKTEIAISAWNQK